MNRATVLIFFTIILPVVFSQWNQCEYNDVSDLTLEIARKMLKLKSGDDPIPLEYKSGSPTFYASSADPMNRVFANVVERKAVEIIRACFRRFQMSQGLTVETEAAQDYSFESSTMMSQGLPITTETVHDNSVGTIESSTMGTIKNATAVPEAEIIVDDEPSVSWKTAGGLGGACFVLGLALAVCCVFCCTKEAAEGGYLIFETELDRRETPGSPTKSYGFCHNFLVALFRGVGVGLCTRCGDQNDEKTQQSRSSVVQQNGTAVELVATRPLADVQSPLPNSAVSPTYPELPRILEPEMPVAERQEPPPYPGTPLTERAIALEEVVIDSCPTSV